MLVFFWSRQKHVYLVYLVWISDHQQKGEKRKWGVPREKRFISARIGGGNYGISFCLKTCPWMGWVANPKFNGTFDAWKCQIILSMERDGWINQYTCKIGDVIQDPEKY